MWHAARVSGDDIEQHYLAANGRSQPWRGNSRRRVGDAGAVLSGPEVRDVLSHVAGIPDDVFAGRIDGVATVPWTAAQVERNRTLGVDELLARWDEQSVPFAALMQSIGQDRPPIDCHAHEHDVRHALGRPGNRDNDIIVGAAGGVLAELREHGVELRGATPFEVFRSKPGGARFTDRGTTGSVNLRPWLRRSMPVRVRPRPATGARVTGSAGAEGAFEVGERSSQSSSPTDTRNRPGVTPVSPSSGVRLACVDVAGWHTSVSGPPSDVATLAICTVEEAAAASRPATSNDSTVPYADLPLGQVVLRMLARPG